MKTVVDQEEVERESKHSPEWLALVEEAKEPDTAERKEIVCQLARPNWKFRNGSRKNLGSRVCNGDELAVMMDISVNEVIATCEHRHDGVYQSAFGC